MPSTIGATTPAAHARPGRRRHASADHARPRDHPPSPMPTLRTRFPAKSDHARWQAATVGTLRIEPLADSVTERWVTEDCPGRFLTEDCFFSNHAAGTQGKWRSAEFGRATGLGAFRRYSSPRARPGQIVGTVSSSSASIADRIAPGSASNPLTVYRRQTLRMARSRSPAAFSTAWRRRLNSSDSPRIRPLSPFC
jgi:hypothetical protein